MPSGCAVSLFSLLISFAASSVSSAQVPVAPVSLEGARYATPAGLTEKSYRLWNGRAPGTKTDAPADVPTITVVAPGRIVQPGTAVVIAPGGGYIGLASSLEGVEPAAWFASRGITAFVLTYRVGGAARLPTVLKDGERAIRFVRAHAAEFGIDPAKIGMMGFSAGGHLAASTAVGGAPGRTDAADLVERVSSRPNFLILGYPWLEGTKVLPDGTSSYCAFAKQAKIACLPSEYDQYQPLKRVTSAAPPTFLYHTTTDELVPVGGTIRFYEALVSQGVSAELHVFAKGRHGTGLGGRDAALSKWPELLEAWLRGQGLIDLPILRRP